MELSDLAGLIVTVRVIAFERPGDARMHLEARHLGGGSLRHKKFLRGLPVWLPSSCATRACLLPEHRAGRRHPEQAGLAGQSETF